MQQLMAQSISLLSRFAAIMIVLRTNLAKKVLEAKKFQLQMKEL